MKKGYLSNYFMGIAAKRLSAVEASPEISHQHEFNGVGCLKTLLGTEKQKIETSFVFLGDDDENNVFTSEGFLTWYDARERHPTRSEYRLYFSSTIVTENASEGDLLIIAKRTDCSLVAIIVKAKTSFEHQMLWLFGLSDELGTSFKVQNIRDSKDLPLNYAARYVLDELGIEVDITEDEYLDNMLELFEKKFPSTRIFSEYARGTLPDISSQDNPDEALMTWINQEEKLFRTFEKYFVTKRIEQGFSDVDSFIEYSLSVHNRRKSRAGFALENHLEQIFKDYNLNYSREKITENRKKPDFIFPNIEDYTNDSFDESRLTMLGVKSTCKDRWRQVLSEANRIKEKNLFTLEPGISENQTDEMIDSSLQLVLPREIHQTYTTIQQSWLMDLCSFIELLETRQKGIQYKIKDLGHSLAADKDNLNDK